MDKVQLSEAPGDLAPDSDTREDDGTRTRNLKREDVGPIMVVWSRFATRQRLKELRAKFRKAIRGWDGIIVHLLPGESIGSMKLIQAQALYESLLKMFDPDLYDIREARKAAAMEAAKAKQEARNEMTANQIANRLESLQKSAAHEQSATIMEATARIEAASRSA